MRKRSDVVGVKSEAGGYSRHNEPATSEIETFNGIDFIVCAGCKLKQSMDSAKRDPETAGGVLRCMSCNRVLMRDPNAKRAACPACGTEETQTDLDGATFFACGCPPGESQAAPPGPPPPPPAPPKPPTPPTPAPAHAARPTGTQAPYVTDFGQDDAGEEVTVTWGEELITPLSFNSYRIGPFSGVTKVRPDETRAIAGARLYSELAEIAEATRTVKREAFLQDLAGTSARVKGGR